MGDILDTLSDLEDEEFEVELTPANDDSADSTDGDEVEADLAELDEFDEDQMSEARAREITEAIRSAATVTYVLLAQAHAQNAHRALGYETWADYVREEFDMSAQRSYQLLDLSKVTNEIESVVPEGTEVKITEAQARDIKRELPMVTEKIREAIDEGEDPEDAVERVVDEAREQKKAEEKAAAAKEKAAKEAEEEGYRQGLEAAADAILEANPDGGEPEGTESLVTGDDAALSAEDSMNLYNFFNLLTGVSSLPEPDDFVKIIPKNRAEEVENQLMEAVTWLNRFQTLWELEQDS